MSHLALVRASSTDGKSLEKLKMTLADLQCSLSGESKSSERFVPPHTDIPYVTAGIITLKLTGLRYLVYIEICSSS